MYLFHSSLIAVILEALLCVVRQSTGTGDYFTLSADDKRARQCDRRCVGMRTWSPGCVVAFVSTERGGLG